MFVPDCDMKRAFVLWQRGKDWPGAAFESSIVASCWQNGVSALRQSPEHVGWCHVPGEAPSQLRKGGWRCRAGHLPATAREGSEQRPGFQQPQVLFSDPPLQGGCKQCAFSFCSHQPPYMVTSLGLGAVHCPIVPFSLDLT